LYKHDRTVELMERFDDIFKTYKGDITILERAVGAYFVGRRVGWKVMYVIHDTKTLKKYEKILGINFREEFKDFEDLAPKTRAYKALKFISNFWKAVKGETSDFDKSAIMGK
jgi:hypothetical protein